MTKKSPKAGKEWFKFSEPRNEADGTSSASIYVYDVIGSDPFGGGGIDAQDFVQNLAQLDVDQIDLYVNSPGGSAFAATAMTNALLRHPANIDAHVDGIAASAASFLITAADTVEMGFGATLMIHDAYTFAMGNAADLHAVADSVDGLSNSIASFYASKAGGTTADWRSLMQEETWFSAEEAVEAGLADSISQAPGESPMPSNVFDLSAFNYQGRKEAPEPPIALIRAVALAHPHVSPDFARAFAPVTTQDRPAPIKEATVTDTVTAPEAPAVPSVQNLDETPQLSDAALDRIRAMFKDEMAGAIVNAAAAPVMPGVPQSLAAPVKEKGASFNEMMRAFSNRAARRESKEQAELIKSSLTTAGDVWDSLTNVSFGDATAGGLVHGELPQWIDELVTRYHIPGIWELINHSDLTNPVIQGFVYSTEPTGGTKADGGGAVTSTGPKWVASTTNASRWAGADSFDRMAFDFGIQASLLESYFRVQLLNYYTWREGILLTALTASATVTYNNAPPASSSITTTTNQILTGMVNVFTQSGALANIASVTSAGYLNLLRNSALQAPAFITIDAGALTEGEVGGHITVRPDATATLTTGQVLVAAGSGVTGYELPGSPVRAEQIQVSIGNIDVGLFGYCAAVRDSVNFVSLVGAGS